MHERLPRRAAKLWRCATYAAPFILSGCFLVGYEKVGPTGPDSGPPPNMDAGESVRDAAFDASDAESPEGGYDLDSSARDGQINMDAGADARVGDGGEVEGGWPEDGGFDAGDAEADAGPDDLDAHIRDADTSEGGSAPLDSGVFDAGGADGGPTETCAESNTCAVDCSNDPYCSIGCSLLSTCSANCSGVDYCVARCESLAACTFDCRYTGRCRATCTGILGVPLLGSTCTIDCRNAGSCDEVRCEAGAKCMVRCAGAGSCDFDYCHASQGPQSCASGVIVCGRPCP